MSSEHSHAGKQNGSSHKGYFFHGLKIKKWINSTGKSLDA